MARIDLQLPIQHVGDNRHSPLKIVDAALHPYHQRPEESRKVEQQVHKQHRGHSGRLIAPKKVKEMMGKVTRRG